MFELPSPEDMVRAAEEYLRLEVFPPDDPDGLRNDDDGPDGPDEGEGSE